MPQVQDFQLSGPYYLKKTNMLFQIIYIQISTSIMNIYIYNAQNIYSYKFVTSTYYLTEKITLHSHCSSLGPITT